MEHFLEEVSNYVTGLLARSLSHELHFHNINHTFEVVEAAKRIGYHCGLSENDRMILITAAWFHDCGYSKVYTGHEEESKKIADSFLKEKGCSPEFITGVLNAIEATKFPQQPVSLIGHVICDADLYHFTRPDYPKYEAAIRHEFEAFLNKRYSDEEWKKINCRMLNAHSYFTEYGKKVLVKFKEINVRSLGCNVD